jgi:hypothetical protein
MKLTSIKSWLIAAAFIPAWLRPSTANAVTYYLSPFRDVGSIGYIGMFIDGQWIAWVPNGHPDCDHIAWQQIGTRDGFFDDVYVIDTAYDDVIKVVDSFWGGDICGWTTENIYPNHHSLTIDAATGYNLIRGGFYPITMWGGSGTDIIQSYSWDGDDVWLYGSGGDDILGGCDPSNYMEHYYGDAGYDVVCDTGSGYHDAHGINAWYCPPSACNW